ncbi:unnamed protein product [Gordionus sp. m RMFG-2023]|uniref:myosin light chain kinase, smooth muscle-like n=1 Tax=Gordionus sp. m RMFG-2023 TaxID=3053472 RepID=UPI0030E33961
MSKVLLSEIEKEYEVPFQKRNIVIKTNEKPTQTYDIMEEIGKGKFGTVYKCKEKKTNQWLACKQIDILSPQIRKETENEIDIMKSLQHRRLLQLYDAYDYGKTMVLILELITGGELFERVIDDEFDLTERSCVLFMRQICEGVEFMHSLNILHLDLKPENILCITQTGNQIKIIDFGLARRIEGSKDIKVMFGTPEFVAPEVINYDKIGKGTDLWSIGIITYVLLSGLSPFMGQNEAETLSNVTKLEWDFEDESFDEISENAKNFISKLLLKDQKKRMTASECLKHPWLTMTQAEKLLSKGNLKKFVVRRKWNKAKNAFLALKRMGAHIK